MTRPPTTRPGRRTVLTTFSLAVVASLTGCDVRLEKGSPQLPGLVTQGPPADQAALRRALTAVRSLRAAAANADGPWAAKLATAYGVAMSRLTQVMASDGITEPSASTTPAPTGLTAARLGGLQRASLSPTAYVDVVHATTPNAAMLAALLAFGAAGATVQGAAPEWTGEVLSAPVSAALLPSVRAAVYGMEVIVARTAVRARPRAAGDVVTLDAARSRLELAAGTTAPAARLVYPLSVPPATDADRATLARDLLADVVTACASQARPTPGTSADLRALVHLWSDATAMAWRWGAVPTPFPGLIG